MNFQRYQKKNETFLYGLLANGTAIYFLKYGGSLLKLKYNYKYYKSYSHQVFNMLKSY